MSIRLKLVLPIVFVWIIFLFVAYFVQLPRHIDDVRQILTKEQHEQLSIIDDEIISSIISSDLSRLNEIGSRLLAEKSNWKALTIYNADKKVVFPILSSPYSGNSETIFVEHPLEFFGQRVGKITVEFDTTMQDVLAKQQVLSYVFIYTIPAIFIIFFTVWFQETTISRPIRTLTDASSRIAKGELDFELPNSSNDEIGRMASQFNEMRTRISYAKKSLENEALQAKQSELIAARENEEKLKAILDNVVDAIFTIDVNGIITSANNASLTMFGYAEKELIGQNVAVLIPDDSKHKAHDYYLYKYLNGGTPGLIGVGRELSAKRKDGSIFQFEIAISEFHHKGNRGFIGIVRDISKRKKTEQMLKDAKDMAEHASEMKSRFVANMSHELRTPLNGVLGMLELLKDTVLSQQQSYFVDIAMKAGDTLHNLIDSILDFSKIEAGQVALEALRFNPLALAQGIVSIVEFDAIKNQNQIEVQAKSFVPAVCVADQVRISQIMTNLISNANKFCSHGRVTITVNLTALDMNQLDSSFEYIALIRRTSGVRRCMWLTFEVIDTGIGIPENRQDALFQPFTQADASTTRKYGGTGLGLSICKQLSELMGGEINFSSVEGEGTRFWFRTPVGVVEDELLESQKVLVESKSIESNNGIQSEQRAVLHQRVLVVEDNVTNQLVLKGMLQKLGFEVDVAENGELGIAAIDKNDYVGIFMDVQMPVMDGIETTKRIRLRNDAKRNSLIIGVSADATIEVRNESLRQGMNDYLTKPVNMTKLKEVVDRNIPL